MKKRILPVLLALALLLSLVPMVFATGENGESGSGGDGTSTEQPSESPSTTPDPSESPSTTPDPSESPSTTPDPSESPSTSPEPGESENPDESEEPSAPVCTGEANCPAAEHTENACKSQCTMSAGCTNTATHHKTNCVAACTYDPESEEADNGTDCANTSGDPSVHKAGCPKATVSDSVVLDPSQAPAESEKPDESEKPGEINKAEDFSDVNAGDWFAAELTTVIEKGWVKGNEDGSFDPEGDVSGEQAVVFVSRMLNKGFNTEGANWADEATKWAAEDGLTEGIEITSEGIARKDLILLLWRAAGKPASDKEVTFTDLDGVEGDHLTALKWAVENGIILGNDDGTFTPAAATSRSQIAAILVRCDKAVNK